MADNSHLFDILVGMQLDSSNLESQGKAAAAKFSKGFGVGFNASNIARPLGSISGKASEFQKSIEASSARVLAFGATTSAIFGLKASFDKLVESTIEVEKETTGINAIFGLSLSGLKSFTSGLLNAANQTGQSFAMASQAAQEFSRQGLSAEETLKRTRAALILNRISGLDMADSISSLTSVINGFSKEALDATDIINRMTAVDTQFAVSAGDLASALQRVGASANDANVSFNQTLALVTAARQITGREGTVIGNALKTIFTRLQRPEVLNDLEEAGVQTRNLQGQVLPLTDVLKNLATTYDTLAQSQKSAVAESVGSVYQINILKGLLKDSASGASIYSGALNAIATASDTTSQRLDTLNSTMASGIVRTMNDLTLAASNVGNALLGSAMKQGISVFDTLLKQVNAGFNNDKPKTTTQKADNTAITAGISGVANVLSGPGIQIAVQLISKLLSNLVQFGYQSSKDLLGLDANMKQAIALEERYIELLEKDEALTQQILQGKIGIVEAGQRLMAQSNGNPVSNSILKSVVGVAVAETQRPNTSSVPNLAIGLEGINPEEFVMWEHNSGNILGKYKTQANAGRAADRYKNTYNSYNEVYKNPSYRTGLKGEYISYLGNVAIRNALYRENQATGGHAILSQSSKLMSEQNPHGFAAIDSRTQKNADDAIRQHEYLGQSINDISKNKTSAGFIPNFARQLAEIQRPNTSSVPNLFNPVQEALRKENALTGGNAALSSSPLLVTSQNPYGLAAIDSRNQKNATDAVMQHKFAGQTLSQIKNNRTKNSFVPNLANDFETSLFLGLAGAFTQSSTAISKFARIFPALYTAQERQLAEIQKTTQAYDKMVNSFRAGNNQPQAFGNKTYNSIEDVYGDKALTTQIAQQTDILKNATKIKNNERTNLIGTGFKTSLVSSGIGGVASTLGSEIGGKDFGAAINELQSGITEAGQSLIAFPNRLGKALSAGFVASSFFSAFDSWTKHLNDARDKADAEQSRIKTLTDNIDTLSTSINNLNSMYLDATTQTQTLIDENQKYTEALASLSTQQGGGKIVNQLLTAPDEESKIGILAAQKEQLGIQNRLTQQILEAREESAKKSFLGFSSFGKQQGYTYDQDEDRSGEEETLKNNANLAISAMSATMQKTLGDTLLQGGDFTKQLNNPDNDFANSIIKELGGAHGGQAGIDKLLLEIQALLAQSAKYNDPAVIVARQKAVEGTQNAQFNVNNAVRTQQFLERLFLNQGSLAGGNVLDLRKLNYQTQYNQRALQLSGLENNANLFSQTHGERTTARYNYGVATQGAALQAQGQLNDLNIGTNRSLIESITRNADEILGKANPNAVPGEPNIGIGASNALFTQALNTGLTTVLKGSFSDLISKFKTTGGGFDYASFAKQVAQNSGINNTAVQGKVETYINSQQSIDILKTLNEGNVKQTDILQQFKQQSAENLQKLNATLAEADFKQQVQYLGGIESSLNRQSVKALERQVTRSAAILNNPNATNAAHAQASIQFLDSLKQLGVNLNKDNPEVRVLFDQAEQSIGQNLSDIFGKIQRNVGNVTGGQNSTLSTDITDLLGNINPYKAAQTQVEERYKPEGGVVPGSQGSSAFIDSTKFLVPFNQNLDDSTTQLYAFEQALQKTVAQLGGSAVNTQKAKDILGQTQDQGEKSLRIALDNLSGNLEKFKFQEPSQQNNPGKFGSVVSTIGFGAAYGLGQLLFGKGAGFVGAKLFPKSQVGENVSSSLGNETTESIEKAAESLEKVATKMEKSLGGSSGINLPGTYGPKGAGSSSARNIIRVNLPSKGGLTEIPKLEQDLEGGTNPAIRNFLPPSPPRIITPKLFNIGNTEKGYSKILQDADAARNEISQLVNNYGKSLNKIAQDISLGRKTLLRINGKDETEFSAWKGLDKQTVLNRLGEMGASPEKYKNDLYKEMQEEAMRRRIKLSNFIQKGRGINEDRIQRANQGTQENFENYSAASVQNSRNIDVQNQSYGTSRNISISNSMAEKARVPNTLLRQKIWSRSLWARQMAENNKNIPLSEPTGVNDFSGEAGEGIIPEELFYGSPTGRGGPSASALSKMGPGFLSQLRGVSRSPGLQFLKQGAFGGLSKSTPFLNSSGLRGLLTRGIVGLGIGAAADYGINKAYTHFQGIGKTDQYGDISNTNYTLEAANIAAKVGVGTRLGGAVGAIGAGANSLTDIGLNLTKTNYGNQNRQQYGDYLDQQIFLQTRKNKLKLNQSDLNKTFRNTSIATGYQNMQDDYLKNAYSDQYANGSTAKVTNDLLWARDLAGKKGLGGFNKNQLGELKGAYMAAYPKQNIENADLLGFANKIDSPQTQSLLNNYFAKSQNKPISLIPNSQKQWNDLIPHNKENDQLALNYTTQQYKQQIASANDAETNGRLGDMISILKNIDHSLGATSKQAASQIDFSTLPITISVNSLDQLDDKSKNVANTLINRLRDAVANLQTRVDALDGKKLPSVVNN